jgi:hypothetical protein
LGVASNNLLSEEGLFFIPAFSETKELAGWLDSRGEIPNGNSLG